MNEFREAFSSVLPKVAELTAAEQATFWEFMRFALPRISKGEDPQQVYDEFMGL